jgi:PAS domain S-box-containing protein
MIQETLKNKNPLESFETEIDHKDGDVQTVLVSADTLTIGGEMYVLTVGTDISERKRMEKALQESEEKFSKAFKAFPDAVAITTLVEGKYLEVNDCFLSLNGYTREEVIGHQSKELDIWVNKEDRHRIKQMLDKDGRFENEEFIFRRKTGELRTVLLAAEIINYGGKPHLLTIGNDVTERKQIEKALQESEAKFSKAFHSIPESISISRLENGKFTDVNDSFCLHNGHTREEVIGHTAVEIGLWDAFGGRDQILQILDEKGRIENKEFDFKTKTGEVRTVLVSAEIIPISSDPHILVIGNDITERNQMEKALRESEELFSKAFEAIPESLVVAKARDGVFLSVNKNFLRAQHFKREEVIGRSAEDLKIWTSGQNEAMVQRIKTQGAIVNDEMHFTLESGEPQTISFSADIINIGGEPCIIATSNDITERKRMEKALQESEEKFSKAFHSIPEAVSITRVKDGVFIDANNSFCRTTNLTREEVIGRTAADLHLWEKPGERDRIIQQIKEQGSIVNEERSMQHVTGEIGTVLFSADIINIGGETCLISIRNDITERKGMEQALRESEEKFSKAFHTIPEAVAIATLEDSIFVEVNENFLIFNGLTREEAIGHSGKELNLWANPDDRRKMMQQMQEKGRVVNLECNLRRKSGEIRNVLFSAEIINYSGKPCMLSIANDFTERKLMEQALTDEATRKRILIEQSSDGIVILNDNGGVYEANRRFSEMIGYSPEELSKLNVWDWEFSKSRETMIEMIKAVGEGGDHFETKHRRKDGSTYDVDISTNGALFAGQKLIFCVCRDVTRRKQAQEKLNQTMVELEVSAAKLKATNKELESFSYSVSHDLRSPLRSIDGFSQALLEDYSAKLDETAKDYLNRLRSASQKMGELIDGLLKLSRLNRSEMRHETVDLSTMAEEILSRLQETNPERKAKITIDKGLNAEGDPQMLRVVMENLLNNAWKFTKKTPHTRIEFGSTDNGDKKGFFIRDNGAGFDMAFKDNLFGAFQRLHDVADFPGTGIGLATVQRIINRHGGSIRAEGAVGKGAAFYFTLS